MGQRDQLDDELTRLVSIALVALTWVSKLSEFIHSWLDIKGLLEHIELLIPIIALQNNLLIVNLLSAPIVEFFESDFDEDFQVLELFGKHAEHSRLEFLDGLDLLAIA